MKRLRHLGIFGFFAISACARSGAVASPTAASGSAPSAAGGHPETGDSKVLSTNVPALGRPVTSFGAAIHGGTLYTYGGYFGAPHAYSREGQTGDLTEIDLKTGRTTVVATGPGVQGAQIVSTPQGLIRAGGMNAENAREEKERIVSLTDVARFDSARSKWEPLAVLPEGRSSHAAVFLDGQLFVLGGWTLAGSRNDGKFATEAFVIDVATGKARKIAGPEPVRAAQAALLGGNVVMVGGMNAKGETQRAVHILDPKTGTWSKGPEFPSDAFGVAVAGNGQSIFASAKDGVLYELKQGAGAWRKAAYLAFPRFFHQMAMLGDHTVVALGGIGGMQHGVRIAHIETIDVEARTPRILTWKLENPSPAKNRQGAQIVGDELVLFGGNRSLEQHDFGKEDFRTEAFAIDLATMRTKPVAKFPVGRQTVQTTLVDKTTLLALGGFGHDGQKARAHADAYTYDPIQKGWTASPSALPSPRTQFGLVAKGDDLWVFGGLDYDPTRADKSQFIHPTTVLKASQGKPFAVAPVTLPHPRRAFGGALLDEKYYLVGGMAGEFALVPSCDVFDFASSGWSTVTCPTSPRISPQLVALDGKLYLAGGSTLKPPQDLTPNPALETFDPRTNSWSTLVDSIGVEPRHLAMQAYHHALVLYSAHHKDDTADIAMIVPPVVETKTTLASDNRSSAAASTEKH